MNASIESESIQSIKAKLKSCDPDIKNYVTYLKKENAKLHRKIVKLEVENMTSKNRILALKKENKELHKNPPSEELLIKFVSPDGTKTELE